MLGYISSLSIMFMKDLEDDGGILVIGIILEETGIIHSLDRSLERYFLVLL